jgi:hypothetical protein
MTEERSTHTVRHSTLRCTSNVDYIVLCQLVPGGYLIPVPVHNTPELNVRFGWLLFLHCVDFG